MIDALPGAEVTPRLQQHFGKLAFQYEQFCGGRRIARLPGSLAAFGIGSAILFALIAPTWIPFGVFYFVVGMVALLVIGTASGHRVLMSRGLATMKAMPKWELALGVSACVITCVLLIRFQLWPSALIGGITGGFTTAIAYLLWIDPFHDDRENIEEHLRSLIQHLESHGYSPMDIEMGLPVLLGDRWANLFEAVLGYGVYRGTRHQLESMELHGNSNPPIEDRTVEANRKLRDTVCDCLTRWTQRCQGPITGLIADMRSRSRVNASVDHATASQSHDASPMSSGSYGSVSSSEPADSNGFDFVGEPTGGSAGFPVHSTDARVESASARIAGNATVVAAKNLQVKSIEAEHLELHLHQADGLDSVSEALTGDSGKKQKLDQLFADARSTRDDLGGRLNRDQVQTLNRYLGDEARLTVAMLLFIASITAAVKSGLFTTATWNAITGAWSQETEPIGSILAAIGALPEVVLPPGLCGWGLLVATIIMAGFSIPSGWTMSVAAIVACFTTIISFTMVNVLGQPGEWIIAGLMITTAAVALAVLDKRSAPKETG